MAGVATWTTTVRGCKIFLTERDLLYRVAWELERMEFLVGIHWAKRDLLLKILALQR